MRYLFALLLVASFVSDSFASDFTFANLDWNLKVDTAVQTIENNLGDAYTVYRPSNKNNPIENGAPSFFGPTLFPTIDAMLAAEHTCFHETLSSYRQKYCWDPDVRDGRICRVVKRGYEKLTSKSKEIFGIIKITARPKGETIFSEVNFYFVNPSFPDSSIAGILAWVSVRYRMPPSDHNKESSRRWPPETDLYNILVKKYGAPPLVNKKVPVGYPKSQKSSMPEIINYCEWKRGETYIGYVTDAQNLASMHEVVYFNMATMQKYEKAYSEKIDDFALDGKKFIESEIANARNEKTDADKKATKSAQDNI